MLEQSDLERIRLYIIDLDALAGIHRRYDRLLPDRWNGLACVLPRNIEPAAFMAINKQWHAEAEVAQKAIVDATPAMMELAVRHGVGGGAFALVKSFKPAELDAARKAAQRLADAVARQPGSADDGSGSTSPGTPPGGRFQQTFNTTVIGGNVAVGSEQVTQTTNTGVQPNAKGTLRKLFDAITSNPLLSAVISGLIVALATGGSIGIKAWWHGGGSFTTSPANRPAIPPPMNTPQTKPGG